MSSTSFLRYNPLRNRNTKLRPEISGKENQLMLRRTIFLISLLLCLCLFASVGPLQAQIPQTKQNPLIPGQGAKGTAGCTTTEASSCAEAAAKILPIVMGLSPLEENLRRLTDEIGGRVTGSPEMAKAVEWGAAGFRAAGVDVHTEKYTMPVTWKEGATRLTITSPTASSLPLRAVSEGWGPATPRDGIEANVIDIGVGSGADFSQVGSIKGAILLAHSEIGSAWPDLFNEYMRPPAIIMRAVKEGAAAILWTGARERLLLYRHTNTLNGAIDKIPQAVVARADALKLARLVAANPGKVRVKLAMPNEIGGAVEQENVVGEIRGYEKPDEIVILGAHLDSWELGP